MAVKVGVGVIFYRGRALCCHLNQCLNNTFLVGHAKLSK